MAVTINSANFLPTPNQKAFDEHLGGSGKGSVSVEVGKKGSQKLVSSTEEPVGTAAFIPPDQVCRVTVEGSHTVNLGNYESARIGVAVQLPTTLEGLDDTYNFATAWVNDRILAVVKDAKGE